MSYNVYKTEVYALRDITGIIPSALEHAGFDLLTMDLDNTLMGQTENLLAPDRIDFFKKVGRTSLDVALVSNASGERVNRVRRVAFDIGQIIGRECISVVPEDVGGKAKPNPDMFIYALDKANVDFRREIHVGDQVRSDVVGAERACFHTAVVVRPMGEGEDPFVKFIGRPFYEPALRHQRSLPDKVSKFPYSLPDYAYRQHR